MTNYFYLWGNWRRRWIGIIVYEYGLSLLLLKADYSSEEVVNKIIVQSPIVSEWGAFVHIKFNRPYHVYIHIWTLLPHKGGVHTSPLCYPDLNQWSFNPLGLPVEPW